MYYFAMNNLQNFITSPMKNNYNPFFTPVNFGYNYNISVPLFNFSFPKMNFDFNNFNKSSEKTLKNEPAKSTDKNLDKAFLEKTKEVSKKVGCNYKDLLALMNAESGLNSKAVNKKTKATGLIQFMPKTATSLGTSTEELSKMSPHEQLNYVEKYLINAKKMTKLNNKNLSAEDLYTLVFLPNKVHQEVLCKDSSKTYQYNKGLDLNSDGVITKTEVGMKLAKKSVNESIFA